MADKQKEAVRKQMEQLREYVREHPEDARAAATVAPRLAAAGHTDEAARVLTAAIEHHPGDDHLANAAFFAGSAVPSIAPRLIAAYRTAHDKDPDSMDIQIGLCRVLGLVSASDKEASREQIELAEAALAERPDSFSVRINAHQAYLAAGNEEKAIEHLAKAIAVAPKGEPTVPFLGIHLAARLDKVGRPQDALGVLADTLHAYGLTPGLGGAVTNAAWTEIGRIRLKQGDAVAAIAALRASANVPFDEALKQSGLRKALAEELDKAGHASDVAWYSRTIERAEKAREGQWLGSHGSVAYARYVYRALALPLWVCISAAIGLLLAGTLRHAGAKGSPLEIMIGAVGVYYGISLLRGAFGRGVRFAGPIIHGAFTGIGIAVLAAGALFIVQGWLWGLIAAVVLGTPWLLILIRFEMLVAARRKERV